MSLQVWLPLTKDLRNQGLSNVTVTNNGATFNSAGKLGGCYKTSSTATIDLGYNGNQVNTGSISFGGWFNFNKAEIWSAISGKSYNTNANAATGCLIGNNSYGGVSLQWYTNNIYTSNSLTALYVQGYLRSSTNGARATSGFSLPFDAWVHIYFTFDKVSNIMTLYINGENKYTYTNVAFSDARNYNLFVNLASIAGGNGPAASIPFLVNDVRIYDHCLSPMEVKELSKGLVLHYPLNRGGWGQENLHKNSDTITSTWSVNQGTVSNGIVTLSPTTNSDRRIYQMPANGGWTWQSGKTYTASIDAKSSNGAILGFYPYGAGSMTQAYTVTSEWKRYSFTFTATQSGTASMTYQVNQTSGVTLQLRHPKLEEGSVATPWCPNSSDVLATTMGLNGTTEYDCSGFCNNGMRTGTFSWTSDTPKYQVSTKFDSTFSKIKLPVMSFTGMTNSYTFAWWQYNVSTGNMPWGFSDGNRLNCYHTSPLCWNTGDGGSNQFKDGNTTIAPATVQNGWHHMVVTGDGTATKLYIDGVYKGTATTYKPLTGTQIWISGWDSGTSYTFNGSKECDFRIYATALSADDVKSLYQNCATIDPDGTIRGQIRS